MSDLANNETPPCDLDESTNYTGRCKWFNNKAGYGFLTVIKSDSEEDDKVGTDVFVHHSGVKVSAEQYKYLVQGEYVDFTLRETDGGKHSVQAADITGVGGGQLMCETRYDARKQQEQERGEDDHEGSDERRNQRRRPSRGTNSRGGYSNSRGGQVRLRGEGPRDGEVWTLTRSNVKTNVKSREDSDKEEENKE